MYVYIFFLEPYPLKSTIQKKHIHTYTYTRDKWTKAEKTSSDILRQVQREIKRTHTPLTSQLILALLLGVGKRVLNGKLRTKSLIIVDVLLLHFTHLFYMHVYNFYFGLSLYERNNGFFALLCFMYLQIQEEKDFFLGHDCVHAERKGNGKMLVSSTLSLILSLFSHQISSRALQSFCFAVLCCVSKLAA